jgi:hypothetical protein
MLVPRSAILFVCILLHHSQLVLGQRARLLSLAKRLKRGQPTEQQQRRGSSQQPGEEQQQQPPRTTMIILAATTIIACIVATLYWIQQQQKQKQSTKTARPAVSNEERRSASSVAGECGQTPGGRKHGSFGGKSHKCVKLACYSWLMR